MFGVRYAVAGAITGYQRWISPYEGFHCAHWRLHGGESCSAFGKRLVIEQGIRGFFLGMQRRFDECHRAALALRARRQSQTCLADQVRPGDTVVQEADDGDSEDARRKKRKDDDGGCIVEDCFSLASSCNPIPYLNIRCSGD